MPPSDGNGRITTATKRTRSGSSRVCLCTNPPAAARLLRRATVGAAAAELVPGDIVVLRTGDCVPADCRVLHVYTKSFKTDQVPPPFLCTPSSVAVPPLMRQPPRHQQNHGGITALLS